MVTIHFYLRYTSTFGQTFYVTGNIPQLGNNIATAALPIQYLNDAYWHGSIEVNEQLVQDVQYNYILKNADGFESIEFCRDRKIDLQQIKAAEIKVIDTWNYAGEYENTFFTQPFQQTLLKAKTQKPRAVAQKNCTHIFKIKAPLLQANETLCLVGSDELLSNWQTEKPALMQKEGNWFAIKTNLAKAQFPIAYKYGVWNLEENKFTRFEDGNNRTLHGDAGKKQVSILHDGFAHLPNNTFKAAGIAIPVFSLKTNSSLGVGEFADIKLLVDWCKKCGLKLIQLLPLNDTTATNTWQDSYPYAAISAFALNPIYINLNKVAGSQHAALLKPFLKKQKQLNALPVVNYEWVMKTKRAGLKLLFDALKTEWEQDAAYQIFYESNKHWLLPYAVFCYLRDENKTSNFANWKKHQQYNEAEITKLTTAKNKASQQIQLHLFTQFHLHLQLKEMVEYAHKNGIIMKGDIPIGIYRHSCDAWVNPALFKMDAQAGAPPDDFATNGQNWGFPTYNWQAMQQDGFKWWKQRFEQMSHYFDAFRVDHILGFFRIWSIPMQQVQGILGKFDPCIPIHISEFANRGIWFDYDRYCKPFINEMVLQEFFGSQASWIKETFLQNNGWGHYALTENYNTQQKIENWFSIQTEEVAPWVKEKLFDLVSNVILLDDAQTDEEHNPYHFRIGMDATASFRYLDDHTKTQLKELYVDYFFRRQDGFWRKEAMQKLPALKASTNMLICGEDLGMVPDCVPGVMKDLGLLSLEIQRMPKEPTKQFFHPADAPYLSVVTPSTHDMSTIRGWWEEHRTNTQLFYNNELGKYGEAPFYCEPWINKEIVVQHLYSPAMWSIFQLQDLMGMDGQLRRQNPQDERINIPANPHHYWQYRMHIGLETLLKAKEFNEDLKTFIISSGRN